MNHDDVRRIALSFPGTREHPHHGFPSFRARTIFATLPEPQRARILLTELDIRACAAMYPHWTREFYWGRRLAALEVDLAACQAPELITEWLEAAYSEHR